MTRAAKKIRRRKFLGGAMALGAAASLPAPAIAMSRLGSTRPNILVLVTDQQLWTMMGCMGNAWLRTPAMDGLAASGMRFDLAYVTNPVCSPSRFSLQTGRMPSIVGTTENGDAIAGDVPQGILDTSLGPLFRRAGYDAVYGGKVHLARAFRDDFAGRSYRYFERDERDALAQSCAAFLKEKHEKPFFLTASLINPHDICFLAINAWRASRKLPRIFDGEDTTLALMGEIARKDRRKFVEEECPPLPANHAIPELEPEAIATKYLKPVGFRQYVRERWTEEDWRIHRWVYCRLTERVDREIATVLDALREAGLERDTLVVLTSDHGDLAGAHKLEHKSVLYEEAMRVPFLVSQKGAIPEGRADTSHLVSNGLDLLPTLCDWAGIALPDARYDGRSLAPLLRGEAPADWRRFLVVESQHDRMIRTERFKYCAYTTGAHREQLNDLEADPGEMANLAERPEYADTVRAHRDMLRAWMFATWDYDFQAVTPY
ncbi:MAG: sulfatase-like hydrolase/transferase [Alphaproteobacteria bacterium]|nr:sulfatase-like hydrolase/transferase [Alphaproteobacteria bacterium]